VPLPLSLSHHASRTRPGGAPAKREHGKPSYRTSAPAVSRRTAHDIAYKTAGSRPVTLLPASGSTHQSQTIQVITSASSGPSIGGAATVASAVAGYVFNYFSGSRDRDAARKLAEDQQSHERQLRRSDRLYDDNVPHPCDDCAHPPRSNPSDAAPHRAHPRPGLPGTEGGDPRVLRKRRTAARSAVDSSNGAASELTEPLEGECHPCSFLGARRRIGRYRAVRPSSASSGAARVAVFHRGNAGV
jgi:hypothetical protein